MTKIPTKLRLGKRLEGDASTVQKQLDDVYNDVAKTLNRKTDLVVTDRDPGTQDDGFDLGTTWLNQSSGNKFILTDQTPTWTSF